MEGGDAPATPGGDTGQALSDIQNYLAEFNKDITQAPAQQQMTQNADQPPVLNCEGGGYGDVGQNGVETVIAPPDTEGGGESVMPLKQVSGLDQLAEASEQMSAEQQAHTQVQQPDSLPETEEISENTAPVETATQDVEAPVDNQEITEQDKDDTDPAEETQPAEEEVEEEEQQTIIMTTDGQQVYGDLQNVQLVAVQGDGDGSQPQLVAMQPETTASSTVTSRVSPASTSASGSGNQVVLNTGGSYQTVTIMPSESNTSGEVSYVLIVSQPEDEPKPASSIQDMSVYDFKEEKMGGGEDGNGSTPRKQPPPRKLPAGASPALMCSYCNYTSPKRYLLTRHMKCHSEERPHKCSICDKGFKTIASLTNHVNTHTGTRPHKCKDCTSAFTTSGELVRHVRYRHTFEKPHKCPECDYASVELSKMKRHIRSHTGERPYQCSHCAYASPDTYKLKRHLRIHTGEKPYECDVCQARFTQSNSLKSHKLIHTGNKPVFQCELCPTTCGRKTDLRIHVQKLHTSDKPLQCKKCAKFFPDRYSYKIHLKTHDGEKCFKCELCPYAALSERFLTSHMLTHTGEKPFECDECDQTFRQKQLLRRHKNLHHNPDFQPTPKKEKIHECGECGKSFAHKGNLLRHMAIHDPTNPMYQVAPPAEGEEVEPEDSDEEEEQENVPQEIQVIIQQVVTQNAEVEGELEVVATPEVQAEPEEKASPSKSSPSKGRKIVVGKEEMSVEDIFKNMQRQTDGESETETKKAQYPRRYNRHNVTVEDEEVEKPTMEEVKAAELTRGRRGRKPAQATAEEEKVAEVEEAEEEETTGRATRSARKKKLEPSPVSHSAKKPRRGRASAGAGEVLVLVVPPKQEHADDVSMNCDVLQESDADMLISSEHQCIFPTISAEVLGTIECVVNDVLGQVAKDRPVL